MGIIWVVNHQLLKIFPELLIRKEYILAENWLSDFKEDLTWKKT
ncbi:hypothetical protein [Nostoc flagelliforme]|nr:hypothetical protein [Nostoc flagelliforme]